MAKNELTTVMVLLLLLMILVSLGTYFENISKKELKAKYSYKVRDDYGQDRGYTNDKPKDGCIHIDSRNITLCGTFEIKPF